MTFSLLLVMPNICFDDGCRGGGGCFNGGGWCDVGLDFCVVVVLVVLVEVVVVLMIVTEVAVVTVLLSLAKNASVWSIAVGFTTLHVIMAEQIVVGVL